MGEQKSAIFIEWQNNPQVGNGVIFLQPELKSRFTNMASPDMFIFASSEHIYLYTHSKFYEVVEGETGLQKKLVEMDKQYFEHNP